MTMNEIVAIVLMIAVVAIVLWDMHRNKKNEPRE
jgi:FtsZ-interacting cell division protein ZipA